MKKSVNKHIESVALIVDSLIVLLTVFFEWWNYIQFTRTISEYNVIDSDISLVTITSGSMENNLFTRENVYHQCKMINYKFKSFCVPIHVSNFSLLFKLSGISNGTNSKSVQHKYH